MMLWLVDFRTLDMQDYTVISLPAITTVCFIVAISYRVLYVHMGK